MKKLVIISSIILLLYVVSFGPAVAFHGWLLARHQEYAKVVGDLSQVVYYPHMYIAAKSESYYNYSIWWLGLGMGEDASKFGTWSQLRQEVLREK